MKIADLERRVSEHQQREQSMIAQMEDAKRQARVDAEKASQTSGHNLS